MGYTHYWELKKVPANYTTAADKIADEFSRLVNQLPEYTTYVGSYYADQPLVLRGGPGVGEPVINNQMIWFNGDQLTGMNLETFLFEFNGKPIRQAFRDTWFCKTGRKPYDQAVCLALLCIANYMDGFEFDSDGYYEEWETIVDFYLEHVPEVSLNLKLNLDKLVKTPA
jgi:hypothetical protein